MACQPAVTTTSGVDGGEHPIDELGGAAFEVVPAKGHTSEHLATTLFDDGLELLERVALFDGIGEVHDAALVVEHRQLLQPAGPPRALTDKDPTVGPGPADTLS